MAEVIDIEEKKRENEKKHTDEVIYRVTMILLAAITEAGAEGIPSGHLYAMITGHMTLTIYLQIISVLVETGKIENKHHVLKAI